LEEPRRKERRLIAADEMIIRVGDKKVFVWVVIDVKTKECLGIWVSMARHEFIASKFIKIVLKYKNKRLQRHIVDNLNTSSTSLRHYQINLHLSSIEEFVIKTSKNGLRLRKRKIW